MRTYKVTVEGKEYNVELVEDRGSSLILNVNGKTVVVELGGGQAVSVSTVPTESPRGTAETAKAGAPSRAPTPAFTPAQTTPAPAPTPSAAPAAPAPAAAPGGPGVVVSKVPGKIIKVLVNEGQMVQENQTVLTMESMKMEIEIKAPKTGRVSQVLVKPGDYVEPGKQMIVIE